MSNALPLKRKQEDETSLPDAKKQRVGGYRSYHDPMASMPHAMEMYDSALAMHQAMKQPQQAMPTAYQQPYGGDSSGYYCEHGSAQSNNAGYYYQQSTNSTMKNNHYYPNETTQAAQPAQTYQQTHYTHSHNALEPGAINTLHGDEIQIYLTCPQFSPLVFHSHGLFLFFGSGFPIFFFGSFKFDGGILWCCIHIRSLFCALSRIFGFVRVRGWIASGFPEQASEVSLFLSVSQYIPSMNIN
eukprot:1104896-Amorphochlora_amoeboformis.AAC.1